MMADKRGMMRNATGVVTPMRTCKNGKEMGQLSTPPRSEGATLLTIQMHELQVRLAARIKCAFLKRGSQNPLYYRQSISIHRRAESQEKENRLTKPPTAQPSTTWPPKNTPSPL